MDASSSDEDINNRFDMFTVMWNDLKSTQMTIHVNVNSRQLRITYPDISPVLKKTLVDSNISPLWKHIMAPNPILTTSLVPTQILQDRQRQIQIFGFNARQWIVRKMLSSIVLIRARGAPRERISLPTAGGKAQGDIEHQTNKGKEANQNTQGDDDSERCTDQGDRRTKGEDQSTNSRARGMLNIKPTRARRQIRTPRVTRKVLTHPRNHLLRVPPSSL